MEALETGNGSFNGEGNTVVRWKPADMTGTGAIEANRNAPNQQNSGNAQYYLFSDMAMDIEVTGVAFKFIPGDWKWWDTQWTADAVRNAQLYFQNIGALTFTDCVFEQVLLTHFANTSSDELVDTVTDCVFRNVYNQYAAKDLRGTTVVVAGCTFENCGGGIMLSRSDAVTPVQNVAITGNTFTRVDVAGDWVASGKAGTRGLVQIAASGDYTGCSFTMTGNTITDCGPTFRQLNESFRNVTVQTDIDPITYTPDSLR